MHSPEESKLDHDSYFPAIAIDCQNNERADGVKKNAPQVPLRKLHSTIGSVCIAKDYSKLKHSGVFLYSFLIKSQFFYILWLYPPTFGNVPFFQRWWDIVPNF